MLVERPASASEIDLSDSTKDAAAACCGLAHAERALDEAQKFSKRKLLVNVFGASTGSDSQRASPSSKRDQLMRPPPPAVADESDDDINLLFSFIFPVAPQFFNS
ncbi:hypothetical protein RI054_11g58710 [Pseudoscourfieldia marina]